MHQRLAELRSWVGLLGCAPAPAPAPLSSAGVLPPPRLRRAPDALFGERPGGGSPPPPLGRA
eukprot:15460225-Alexandrium_andersonii.AAC.1